MQRYLRQRKLKWMLVLNFLVLSSLIFNANDELRQNFELVPYLNDEFKQVVIQWLVIDFGLIVITKVKKDNALRP